MLDIKDIKKRKEYYNECFKKREYEVDLDNLINLYDKQNKIKQEQETLLALKNKGAKEFEFAKKRNAENLEELQANLRANTQKIAELTKEYNEALEEYNKIFLALPNIVVDDTPTGGKENNVVLKEFKEKPKFEFKPKTHIELCKQHNLIDYERAIKIAGEGNWIYNGLGAKLEWAILNFCINEHLTDGFEFKLLPHILKYDCGFGAGQFPKFAEEDFFIDKRFLPNNFLLPTAETALVNLHKNEILKEEELPKKYFAYTPCFRIEAGSNRPDEKGMIRGHQFNKVEMVEYTTPEDGERAWEELLCKAERIVQKLGLHYRLVKLAGGDYAHGMARTYDIEIYIPSMDRYTEVSSVSTALNYQARRTNTKYLKADGTKDYVYTLNASGIATSRIFPAILEQYQNEDGTITIPDVLVPYMGCKVLK
ncbi:MAG: serine--tRNA ligase [Clostridiales bacterium]|nr:serine--tRNA ligase [Clostridiales bacterium]